MVEGSLCQCGGSEHLAVSTGGTQNAGGEDHQSGHGQHDEGIDEHADHSHGTLVLGLFHFSHGMGMGGGAHTGLIGEQAAGHAEAHGFLDGHADDTAHNGLGGERTHEDGLESRQDLAGVHADGDQCAANVEHCHDGHQLLGDGSDALHAAQENEGGNGGEHQTHSQLGNTEGGVECITDGVGLDHVAHEAQGQNDGDGEEGSHEVAQLALEGCPDVVDRAAGNGTVRANLPVLLGQNGFTIDGCHAEEGGHPHPEHSTGAAGDQSGGAAGDVAGANLGSDGGGQGLEGAHAVLAGGLALQADVAEDQTHTLTELADLDEIGADGEVDAAAQQQEQQHKVLVPQNIVDSSHDVGQNCFHLISYLYSLVFDKEKTPQAGCSGEMGVTGSHVTQNPLCPFT